MDAPTYTGDIRLGREVTWRGELPPDTDPVRPWLLHAISAQVRDTWGTPRARTCADIA